MKLAEAQKESLLYAQKQEDFFATISHELRTPVAVIRSYTEALKDGIIPESRHKEYYQHIFSETLSLQRLVNDMLELSRLKNSDFSLEMERVDISLILEDVVRSASLIASQKQIRIQYEGPGEEIPITGDYGRLKQMFMVVLDNAVKYSDAGSEILISTGKQNDRYAVSIKDEGKGIPENMQQLVFQNFYSTSENGLGLGLAIMENIAKRHDIEVSLESRKDSGTVVTFLLPTSEVL